VATRSARARSPSRAPGNCPTSGFVLCDDTLRDTDGVWRQTLDNALQYAISRGVTVVIAAANQRERVQFFPRARWSGIDGRRGQQQHGSCPLGAGVLQVLVTDAKGRTSIAATGVTVTSSITPTCPE
jgi:hypothetical protein